MLKDASGNERKGIEVEGTIPNEAHCILAAAFYHNRGRWGLEWWNTVTALMRAGF